MAIELFGAGAAPAIIAAVFRQKGETQKRVARFRARTRKILAIAKPHVSQN
jgi:hypothetical protein